MFCVPSRRLYNSEGAEELLHWLMDSLTRGCIGTRRVPIVFRSASSSGAHLPRTTATIMGGRRFPPPDSLKSSRRLRSAAKPAGVCWPEPAYGSEIRQTEFEASCAKLPTGDPS